jgi:hypothetical protein
MQILPLFLLAPFNTWELFCTVNDHTNTGPMSASPVDSSLFFGNFNFEFLPFAITSDVGTQFLKIAAIKTSEV